MEIVQEFPTARGTKYDWNLLLDGQVRKLTKGKDFTVSPQSFAAAVYQTGRRQQIAIRCALRGQDVYIQAIKESTNGSGH